MLARAVLVAYQALYLYQAFQFFRSLWGRGVNINGVNYVLFSNFFVFRFCSTLSPH